MTIFSDSEYLKSLKVRYCLICIFNRNKIYQCQLKNFTHKNKRRHMLSGINSVKFDFGTINKMPKTVNVINKTAKRGELDFLFKRDKNS